MDVRLYQCGGENSLNEIPLGLGYLLANSCPDGCTMTVARSVGELVGADVVGLSSNAQGLREAVAVLERLQSTDAPPRVIIGGQGTLWDGLAEYPFDHIVQGEGERALWSILTSEAGSLPKVVRLPMVDDLDSLNPPMLGRCANHFPILSSRGCPFHCSYCSSQAFWGHMRYHSVGRMMEEVECGAKLYPHSRILYILDDLVTANKPRLRRLHEAWMQGEWSKRWELSLFVRADTFDEETARMLVDMNAGRVRFGAESGSDRVLKLLGKTTTVADNQRTVDIGRKYGLDMFAAFMHHVPGETDEERQMTLDFRARNKGYLGDGGWYMYTDFPGTALYDGSNPIETRQRFRPKPGRADWDD